MSGSETTYQYDEAGNRTKIIRGAQNYSVFAYDERDRLSGISHVVGGSTAASVSYTRDGVGSPTAAAWVNGQDEWTVSYAYDAMNRLTYEDHSERGDTLWSYDWVGNRLDSGFEYDAQTDWLSDRPGESEEALLHLGVRFYEPGVGRFGQVDPAREGLNWYQYVGSQPMSDVDPDGR